MSVQTKPRTVLTSIGLTCWTMRKLLTIWTWVSHFDLHQIKGYFQKNVFKNSKRSFILGKEIFFAMNVVRSLVVHIIWKDAIHYRENKFLCEVCVSGFKSEEYLSSHRIIHEPGYIQSQKLIAHSLLTYWNYCTF